MLPANSSIEEYFKKHQGQLMSLFGVRPLAIIAYGSHVEGLAHSESDLDFFFILAHRFPLTSRAFMLEGVPTHCRASDLYTLLKGISNLDDELATHNFDLNHVFWRIRHNWTLYGDSSSIGSAFEGLYPIKTIVKQCSLAGDLISDSISVENLSSTTSLVMLRLATHHLLNAWLLHRGIASLHPKWHARHLELLSRSEPHTQRFLQQYQIIYSTTELYNCKQIRRAVQTFKNYVYKALPFDPQSQLQSWASAQEREKEYD